MAHCWATFLANLNEFYYQNPPQVGQLIRNIGGEIIQLNIFFKCYFNVKVLQHGENLMLWPKPVLPPSSPDQPSTGILYSVYAP